MKKNISIYEGKITSEYNRDYGTGYLSSDNYIDGELIDDIFDNFEGRNVRVTIEEITE